jgi:hypothetical protein
VTDTHRIPEGDEVVAFVAALPSGAYVAASGWVEGVEISVTRSGADEVHAVPGRVALLSLSGPSSGPLMVVLSRSDGEGLVGGQLLKARSAGVTVGVAAGGTGAPAARGAPAGEASPLVSKGAQKAQKSGPPTVGAPGWAALAAIQHDDDETDEAPKYGDRVNHFVFGLCDVMVVRGERMKIRDVHGPGRLREIHLNAVKVLAPTVEDGKRVFKLAKRT